MQTSQIFFKLKLTARKIIFVTSQKSLAFLVIVNMLATSLAPALTYPLTVDTTSLQPIARAAGNALLGLTFTDTVYAAAAAGSVPVIDTTVATGQKTSDARNDARNAANKAADKATQTLKESVFLALNQSLNAMLNSFAYDVATWLASGGKGQQPMFFTQGWGDYLKTLADDAAGNFIESLAGNWLDLNVCEPINPSLKVRIGLGLSETQRPRKPQCSLSDMVNNWSSLINDKNFLNRFDVIYEPEQNDIGIAFSIFNKYNQTIADAEVAGTKDRESGNGFKAVVSKISNAIKTPSSLVFSQATRLTSEQIDQSDKKVQFGPIVLNAVDTFVSTLIGKLFQRLFKEGLAGDSTSSSNNSNNGLSLLSSLLANRQHNDLTSGNGQANVQGQTAQARFLDLLSTGNADSTPLDILSKLSFCPDPKNPGPDECAILPNFQRAIEQGLTLQEAINQGLIDGSAPFGLMDNNATAIYSGLPYRSIVILRTYRIVPVSWQVAAEAINKFDGGKNISLNDLINEYSKVGSMYYDLVDPNWVLVAPNHLCKATGFGPKVLYNEVVNGIDANQDGDFNDTGDTEPQRLIGRAEYCADYQSCIEKNDDGSCKYYGYCTEERSIWDMQGASCKPYYNTCETFQAPNGEAVSYLKNSLNYNGCSADNAGCQWYCKILNPINNVWTCQNQTERVLKTCSQDGGCSASASCTLNQGETACTDVNSSLNLNIASACDSGSRWWNAATSKCVVDSSCVIQKGAVSCATDSCTDLANLLANGSFETPAATIGGLASGWTTDSGTLDFFDRVSGAVEKIYDGKSSIRFYTAGQLITLGSVKSITSSSLALSATRSYTFSGRVYSKLNAGTITLAVYDVASGAKIDSRSISGTNSWQTISFDFSGHDTVKIVASIAGQGTFLSGTAWFDDFRITESCIVNPVTLTLVGTVDQNESKIHLDRDSSECSSDSAGCSQFIRTIPNSGTNIVDNSSFELWPNPNELPTGWQLGENGVVTFERSTSSPLDNYSLKINNDGVSNNCRDFDTGILAAMKPNTTYRVSFWAKADFNLTDDEEKWYAEVLSNHVPNDYYCSADNTQDCDPFNDNAANPNSCVTLNKGVCVGDWQRLKSAGSIVDIALKSDWQRFVFDPITTRAAGTDFKLSFNNCSTDTANPIYIDGVQIEEVSTSNPVVTDYKDYGQANLTYLKKPPVYLNCTGDPSDPDGCASYAPYCKPEEVGCQAFTPLKGGADVPAVIRPTDFCPAECVGYEAYKQSATPFETQQTLEYFIPKTAKQCNAAAAGCDEFTNLDEVAQGGEGREYYSYLRLCQKPSEAGGLSCQSFYTWQGSDETGFQLKVYNLTGTTDGAGNPIPTPAISNIASWPDRWCSDKTLDANGLPNCCDAADDLINNPFCKQFFASNGTVSYQIYDNTISCSDDCHPYRKTSFGEDPTVAEQNCTESHGTWDNGACVYQAIPKQGISCEPVFAGCREYRGNQSGNVYTAFADNFESGETANWIFGQISSESLSVGGHSIKSQTTGSGTIVATLVGDLGAGVVCSDSLPACSATVTTNCYDQNLIKCRINTGGRSCEVNIGDRYCGLLQTVVNKGKSYVLNFWAKASSPVQNFTVEFGDFSATPVNINVGQTNLGADWGYYSIGPFTADDLADINSAQIRFKLSNSVAFYLDNIQLKEITDHVYVIKNSWNTPVSCDTNPYVDPPISAPQYMLNCQQYKGSSGAVYNLKSFDSLCREAAVGCEAMIDTFNSSSPYEQKFNPNDSLSDVTIPADKLVYIVNRPEFQCDSSVKGCEAVGLPTLNTNNVVTSYATAYKINDPDKYDKILCKNEEVGCQEYQSESGSTFFKDPGDKVCEYRTIPGTTNLGWFIKGSVSDDPDCPVTQPGVGAIHPDGRKDFAGLCPSEYNSCTQFIDPVNAVGKNSLFNGNFNIDINQDTQPDGWDILDSSSSLVQQLDLKANTSYTLSFRANKNDLLGNTNLNFVVKDCPGITSYDHSMIYFVTDDNTRMKIPEETYSTDTRSADKNSPDYVSNISDLRQYSVRFSVPDNEKCKLRINWSGGNYQTIVQKVDEVSVRETGVYYELNNSVDKISCNGIVDPQNGCVLFNDRSGVNYKYGEDDISYLSFDSDMSGPGINSGIGVTSCAGNCDSNAVVKVKPDRTCEAWLNCDVRGTYIDDKGVEQGYCAQIGLCDQLDDSGVCTNKIGRDQISEYSDPEQLKNLSGYSNAGLIFSRGVCVAPADKKGKACTTNTECADSGGICDKSVSGEMSYEQMSDQNSQSARVANGNFELSFNNTTEPIGWEAVDPGKSASLFYKPIQVEWFDYKFKIEHDISNVIEGTGYLRLNSIYEADSEIIDIEPGQRYFLSAMVNTIYLDDSKPFTNPEAQLLLQASGLDNNGDSQLMKITNLWTSVNGNVVTCSNDDWQRCSSLVVAKGLGWQKVVIGFTAPPVVPGTNSGATKLKIRLSNFVNEASCVGDERYNFSTLSKCNLGGYSLFDNISLKPVLHSSNGNDTSDYTARTCRIFPTSDALSCTYYRDNSVFFGKYGYCVTTDPANPSQCLQWWPVDQIRGETLDELTSGYSDRVPLYYCTERNNVTTSFNGGGTLARIGVDLPSEFRNFISDSGSKMNYVPFDISDDYTPMFRWPYVQKVKFSGSLFGVDNRFVIWIGIPFSVDMYKDHFCFHIVDFSGTIGGNAGGIGALGGFFGGMDNQTIVQTIQDILVNNDNNILTNNGASVISGLFSADGFCAGFNSNLLGTVYNTPDSEWGGWGAIPIGINLESVVGFPIGIAIAFPIPWSMAQGTFGQIEAAASSYLNQAGGIGGVIGFGTPFGAKIILDTDTQFSNISPDPIPDVDGDILGAAWFLNTVSQLVYGMGGRFDGNIDVNYCSQVVETVTAAGSNKAYASRMSPGSAYINDDPDPTLIIPTLPLSVCTDTTVIAQCGLNFVLPTDRGKYVYYKPFVYKDFLKCPCFYQSSDYAPFGAIVAPANAQYPTAWDSRSSNLYKQPLFYEPPRTSFQPPYQARMGELHSFDGLRQMFARSYGVWDWNWENVTNIKEGGQYLKRQPTGNGPLQVSDLDWDLPNTYCPATGRPDNCTILNQAQCYCRVKVEIDPNNIKVNGDKSADVIASGQVELDFTIKVDPDQQPITSYTVDWGDGNITSVSGVLLRNRTNPDNPFRMYHLYNYWDAYQAANQTPLPYNIDCNDNRCIVHPRIRAKDNWGAESGNGGSDAFVPLGTDPDVKVIINKK